MDLRFEIFGCDLFVVYCIFDGFVGGIGFI